jgi:chromosome segregation ATPase
MKQLYIYKMNDSNIKEGFNILLKRYELLINEIKELKDQEISILKNEIKEHKEHIEHNKKNIEILKNELNFFKTHTKNNIKNFNDIKTDFNMYNEINQSLNNDITNLKIKNIFIIDTINQVLKKNNIILQYDFDDYINNNVKTFEEKFLNKTKEPTTKEPTTKEQQTNI